MVEREQLEARMLSGEPFTYVELCMSRPNNDADRLVDRTIQRLRKRGLIAFKRVRGRPIWRAVEPRP